MNVRAIASFILVVLTGLSLLMVRHGLAGPKEKEGWGGDEGVVLTVVKQGTAGAATTICVGEELKLTATASGLDGDESVSITITDNGGSIASGGSPLIKQNHAPDIGNHTFLATATFSHPNRNDKTATSNTVNVMVVGVQKVVREGTENEGTLYVAIDQEITLKAIPAPAGASFPENQPVWSVITKPTGSSVTGLSGTGATATFAGNMAGDYTVRATCGTSYDDISLIVIDLDVTKLERIVPRLCDSGTTTFDVTSSGLIYKEDAKLRIHYTYAPSNGPALTAVLRSNGTSKRSAYPLNPGTSTVDLDINSGTPVLTTGGYSLEIQHTTSGSILYTKSITISSGTKSIDLKFNPETPSPQLLAGSSTTLEVVPVFNGSWSSFNSAYYYNEWQQLDPTGTEVESEFFDGYCDTFGELVAPTLPVGVAEQTHTVKLTYKPYQFSGELVTATIPIKIVPKIKLVPVSIENGGSNNYLASGTNGQPVEGSYNYQGTTYDFDFSSMRVVPNARDEVGTGLFVAEVFDKENGRSGYLSPPPPGGTITESTTITVTTTKSWSFNYEGSTAGGISVGLPSVGEVKAESTRTFGYDYSVESSHSVANGKEFSINGNDWNPPGSIPTTEPVTFGTYHVQKAIVHAVLMHADSNGDGIPDDRNGDGTVNDDDRAFVGFAWTLRPVPIEGFLWEIDF